MKTKILVSAIMLALAISSADAQTVKRQKNQRQRIKQGVRSGELTRAETVNLVNGQKEIRQEKKEARADGVVTTEERKEIRQDQRQESRKIHRKKNNRRDRN
jgi:methylthioribose-1-phosphate isomerase